MTNPMQVTHEQVQEVLRALGEDAILDIEAVFTPDRTYLIEYNTLANALVNPKPEWVDQIVEYLNEGGSGRP